MQFLSATPARCDETRIFEHGKMLGYGLPRHIQVLAQLRERLCIIGVERIKQLPAAPVGKRSKYEVGIVHCHGILGK
jgi:hypothetical protein